MIPTLSTLYLASEWLIRLIMLPVVVQRRRPTPALAWLVVIFLLPWIGMGLYLLVGGQRLGFLRRRRYRHVTQAVQAVGRLSAVAEYAVKPDIDAAFGPLANLAQHAGGSPILAGNEVEPIADTNQCINQLIADIDAAQRSVHIMAYIWRNDATGRRVAEAVVRAARRGVDCRVLVDAVGSRQFMPTLGRLLSEHGVTCHVILPVNPLRRKFARIDIRNHRKLFIVDGRIAYTGSQNIVDADYGRKGLVWHDLMLRLRGPAVLHLQVVFVEDWAFAANAELNVDDLMRTTPAAGEVALQVAPSGPVYPNEWFSNLLIEAIHHARQHLVITTPYFVPDEPGLLALKLAVMRGAKVELVLPARTDHPVVEAAGRSCFAELLEAGVIIHRFNDGLLHAKTMTVDDAFAMVGTANYDIRSFHLNFELNVLLFGSNITSRLRFMQQHYIDRSTRIDRLTWSRRRWHQTLPDNLAMLMGPLL